MIRFLDLKALHEEIEGNLTSAVERVLTGGEYILGSAVDQFEREFANYSESQYCVGVGNGLDALRLILRAWGIGPGDEVIVSSHTAFPTWLAVTESGATPVPWEATPGEYHADPALLETLITNRTKVILPVHLYGWCVQMEPVLEVGARYGLYVLEDAAQAHGARLDGKPPGHWGHAAAWSFYPSKNLGALGDGGAITTNDAGLAKKLRALRNYGSSTKYINDYTGMNSRLDDIQAAVLSVKLPYLDQWNARRQQIASHYLRELQDTSCELPRIAPGNNPVWHVFPIQHRQRDDLRSHLLENGVETLIHYPIPPHRQTAYQHTNWNNVPLPIAESIADRELSLPMGPHLHDADVSYVIECIRHFDK